MNLGFHDLHGAPKGIGGPIVPRHLDFAGERTTPANPDRNLFTKDLVEDLMPMVEKLYRVSNQPDQRAIAGLSMGGGQSLNIGLTHLELFHWMGAFSSAVRGTEANLEKTYASLLADPAKSNKKIRLRMTGRVVRRKPELFGSVEET